MRRADNLTNLKSGNRNLLEASGSVQVCTGIALSCTEVVTILIHLSICPNVLFRNSTQISIKLRTGDAGGGAVG
jgi:hypothetical protein